MLKDLRLCLPYAILTLYVPRTNSSALGLMNAEVVEPNPPVRHIRAPSKARIVTSRRSKSKVPRAQHNDDDALEVIEVDAITDADAMQKRPKKEDGGNARRELVSWHACYHAHISDNAEDRCCRR